MNGCMNGNRRRKQQEEDGSYKAFWLYAIHFLYGVISFKKLEYGSGRIGGIKRKGEELKWKQKIKNV